MVKNILFKKRIFVIEDDLDQLLIITNTLAFYGMSFHYERWDGAVIRHLIDNLPIDIILLDLMFPKGVTGYAVFANIRAHPLLCNIPVVAVSALDPATEIPKLKTAGFAGFASKPISLEQFADQLSDILRGQQVWLP